MKQFKLFLVVIIFSSQQLFAQARYAYTMEKVKDDVYVLKPEINKYRWVTSNIIFIVNEKDVFVVDSGLLPEAGYEAIKEIKKITSKPVRYLLNTHWHGDHWQGNEAFAKTYPGLQIIASEQGFKSINRNGVNWAKQFYDRYFNYYIDTYQQAIKDKKLDEEILSDKDVALLETGIQEIKEDVKSLKSMNPVVPNCYFSDQLVINSGPRTFELHYLGIGNTSGDAIVYLPGEKVLITGDLVVYPSPYESGMFSPEWLETSEKLATIDYNYLIPGHGEVQHDKEYLSYLNALFREIISQVIDAYWKGKSRPDDINKIVTHESVVAQLNKVEAYQKFTKQLDKSFVPSAIQTSARRIIQGKE